MTGMRDAELVSTEVLLAKPKRFVCEMLRVADGTEIDWYYLDVPESVITVPITAAGDVLLVKQYRHNLRADTLELPAGLAGPGEPLATAAVREMTEETGHTISAGIDITLLGRYYALPSETNKWVNVFLAESVVRGGPAVGDSEIEKYFEMSVVEMPLARALAEVGRSIHGIETAAALMLARARLLDDGLSGADG